MLTPKYLVVTEGEQNQYFVTAEEVFNYIDQLAIERKERGVEKVDEWVWDMKHQYYSQITTPYPEIIVIL